ncbi:MAG TPA: Rdx family protein [Dehalococcoidia bacterium]|nr:Rdx family protein [Dehalococcoidia bacterium]
MDERPTITITYCTACNFTARAAWLAQELLHTFHEQISGVLIVPGTGGVLDVALGERIVYSKADVGRDPSIKELRDALYEMLPGTGQRPHGL